MNNSEYNSDYFGNMQNISLRSAKEVVPFVLEFIKPKSVVDVGCGVGSWLKVFNEYGIKKYLGIDGDYLDRNLLQIPVKNFLPYDLETPLRLDEKYDLIVSLEVAEHIQPTNADRFIDSLTRLGSIVLFSAAIPYQQGEGHVNEQWPEYWVEKFRKRHYVVIDCIRKKIWLNNKIDWYYRQNILLFIERTEIKKYPKLVEEEKNTNVEFLKLIHPECYMNIINNFPRNIKGLSRRLLKRLLNKVTGRQELEYVLK